MNVVSKLEFCLNVGNSAWRLFSFEESEEYALTIQGKDAEEIPLTEYNPAEKFQIFRVGEAMMTIVTGITLGQTRLLNDCLSNAFVERIERMKERDARNNLLSRSEYSTDYDNSYRANNVNSNPYYDDNLDMNQQSQEFWDNL